MRSRALPLILLAGAQLLPAEVSARVYQWVDPGTGTAQLSGRPPAWYRGSQPGPRVQVFQDGRLIDDTARRVAEPERAALRTQAFSPEPLTPVPDPEPPQDREAPLSPAEAAPPVEQGLEVPLPGMDQATIARLKAIIGEWDRRQTEEAKRFLDGQGGTLPIDPAARP